MISSLLTIGLTLTICLPFAIFCNNLIRRALREAQDEYRANGVDPEKLKLMLIAQIQAEEQQGFHPRQWLKRKAIMWSYRHQL
ncbi:hypothetical protein ACFY4C_20840 [Actinomadura viridis]|uniref:hypothetical protein n=1 Tax=Actinomadura viridis TaxID=58110 RepID=UPI0036CF4DEC